MIEAVVSNIGRKESRLKRLAWQAHGKRNVIFVQIKRITFVHKHVLFRVLFLLFLDLLHQDTLSVTMQLGPAFVYTFCQIRRQVHLILNSHYTAVKRLQCQCDQQKIRTKSSQDLFLLNDVRQN